MAHSSTGQTITLEGHGSRTGRQWVVPLASAAQKQRDERFQDPSIVMPTAKTCSEVCLLHVSWACKVDKINHHKWDWQQPCHMALTLL